MDQLRNIAEMTDDFVKVLGRGKEFRKKQNIVQNLFIEALTILKAFGIPLRGLTARRLEKMALAFLAVADVNASSSWKQAKDLEEGRALRSRDIIQYVNRHFGESISPGSYDDIRRKDLLYPVEAGIVVPDKPDSAKNNPSRRYALNKEHAGYVRSFGDSSWEESVKAFMVKRKALSDTFGGEKRAKKYSVELPGGKVISFGPGKHNQLQESVIKEFLPRFGQGAEILYVGDADKKLLFRNEKMLNELNFFELSHGELPDIVAYSRSKNWLFLIEAVHSFGPIDPVRLNRLKRLTEQCSASLVFVTVFANRDAFRKFLPAIAWETEVWIAEDPDHIVHFDGEKFLGPYGSCEKQNG